MTEKEEWSVKIGRRKWAWVAPAVVLTICVGAIVAIFALWVAARP